ncbi:MATE family efflux transporter [Vallitalea guaymasensis]|uniref:Probable multidrug resistance protein NorM n=1 Tax=Vallitalea guaymasensis TaxID=1185412 RepID=A0A8J8MAB7_9FIRM|nr:MATE family efflux transporter [Vallitalea guaymasensis]QUH29282.1 MATE family efflux transporter [Vallitalea guaymasensis]
MNNNTKENKMGTMKVSKLMVSMSIPAILSMLVQALYNIVDSVFVSRVSDDALTAVSLAFPIQLIIIACFVGLGIGINSLISRKLGEQDHEAASNAAEHGILLCIVLYVIILLIGILFANSFFTLFTDSQNIINLGTEYIKIIMIFSFGRLLAQAGTSILQGSGNMIHPMISQLCGAVFNIILDPILIFGYLGFPALGVKGAAIATISAQILSMVYILIVLFTKQNSVKLNLRTFKYDSKILKGIMQVGLPATIMQAIGSVMVTGLNLILAGFGEASVTVLGVYYKLQSLIFMPVFGLSQGVMPIIGYNYGSKNRKRLMKALKLGIIAAVVYMTLGFLVFQIIPAQLLELFDSSDEMMKIGVPAFRIISYVFPLAAVSIMCGTAFQGMGKAYISMIVSILRQLVVLLPGAFILGKLFGLDGVWVSFVLAEIVGIVVVLVSIKKIYEEQLLKW